MVWGLSLRKQRAASCRSARPGCASGKGLRGDPERNEIDGFGHFVFDLGGSPLERAEGLAPKPCEAGAGRVRGLMCACARDCYPKGRDARSRGSGSAASKARPRPSWGCASQTSTLSFSMFRTRDRPIHASGRIAFTQSGKDGIKPRSYRATCPHTPPSSRAGETGMAVNLGETGGYLCGGGGALPHRHKEFT
jgi:hypothetical protein